MSTVFVNILVYRFEEIICTVMLTAFGLLLALWFVSKNLAQTTVMSTVFVNILVYRFDEITCTEHSHVNSIWPFTGFQVSQQESCTDHSHVYNIWLFTCIDIPQKESAQTTVMSTEFVSILVYRFEKIICTEHSHVNSI